jgi:hypothetical protein
VFRGGEHAFNRAASVLDNEEVFSNSNDRDLEIQIHFSEDDETNDQPTPLRPDRLVVAIRRGSNVCRARLYLRGETLEPRSEWDLDGTKLTPGTDTAVELDQLYEACK